MDIDNNLPFFTGTPTITGTAAVGNSLGLTGTGTSDRDGDTVTLSYQWQSDGINVGANALTYFITAAEAGKTISCTITADDGYGGTITANTAGILIDTAPPSSTITAPANGALLSGASYNITGTADDGTGSGVQKVEVSTDGGTTWNLATGTTSWSYNWTLPASGNYVIQSRATDNAGNVEIPSADRSVTVDNTAPSSAITAPANGANLGKGTYIITGTADDGIGSGIQRVEVSTDGGATWSLATGTTSWSYSWSISATGSYTIRSRATDNVGNIETPSAGITVTVNGMDISFAQHSTTVTLNARGYRGNVPLSGKTFKFYIKTYDASYSTWSAWTLLGSAVSATDGTATKSFLMNNGKYRFKAAFEPYGGVTVSSPSTTACIIAPVAVISPASGKVTTDKTPPVSWKAFPGATGYRIQTCPDQYFTIGVSTADLGNVTTADLPELTRGVETFWRVKAILPTGRSMPSEPRDITYKEATSLTGLNANASGGTIQPSVMLSDIESGALSNKTVYFYFKKTTETLWTSAGYATTNTEGVARIVKRTLAVGQYDLKATFTGNANFYPAPRALGTFSVH